MARTIRAVAVVSRLLLPGVCSLLIAGCGTGAVSVLTVKPAAGKGLIASFTQAYRQPDLSGQDELVLYHDPIDDAVHTAPGDPIPPLASVPLKQALVIHIHWRRGTPARGETPATGNAVARWYIFGPTGIVTYLGSGFVTEDDAKNSADVTIHDLAMERESLNGNLRDPLGSFHITGSFHAVDDPGQVKQIEREIKEAGTAGSDRLPATAPATASQ